jgi:scyllo-inositol 2-dehydrogenase (NADP+)
VIRVGVVGLGKMGLSHLSMVRAHPEVDLIGICDSTGYVLDVLTKYTGVPIFTDYLKMLDTAKPDAVIIATPTHLHATMVKAAMERGVHVFCEKPLFLDPRDGVELTRMAAARGIVTQVGYHNRFVASFAEIHRLLGVGAIGTVNTALAESYGPVVLKPSGNTWRSQRATGGGSLYDYAAHPLNLLTWYLGEPASVSGSQLTRVFSAQIDDAVATTLHYPSGTAQLCVNWSDESQRKMTTKITLWGTHGRIYADRQELHVYLRDTADIPEGYHAGWNVRYTTEMTAAPWFYLRGEEYSAQLDAFVRRVEAREVDGLNDFASASVTDQVIALIAQDALREGDRLTKPVDQDGVRPVARTMGPTRWGAPASPIAARAVHAAQVVRQAVRDRREGVRERWSA